MKKRDYLVFGFVLISLLIISGCKEAVGGNVGGKGLTISNNTAGGAVNYGDLVISTNVFDSELYIDGVFQSILTAQNTPFAIKGSKFNTASHLVEVKKEGYKPFSRQVLLKPRQKVFVNAELISLLLNQTITNNPRPLEQRLKVGEYVVIANTKISCSVNRVSAFKNETTLLPNGTLIGMGEHFLIPGEYVTALNKKISCN